MEPESEVGPSSSAPSMNICTYCQIIGTGMLKCSSCLVSHYCNKECQKKDWKQRHKELCIPAAETERGLFVKYSKSWRMRTSLHMRYLLFETFGEEAVLRGKKLDKLLCINISFVASSRSIQVHEAHTLEWDSLEEHKNEAFDISYSGPSVEGLITHAVGIIMMDKMFCTQVVLRAEERKPTEFKDIKECVEDMSEINKVPRNIITRRIKNELGKLLRYPNYAKFVRAALNVNTSMALNRTHYLIVSIKTENGSLVRLESFQLMTTREMYHKISTFGAVTTPDDEMLTLMDNTHLVHPNQLTCVFFEPGVLTNFDTVYAPPSRKLTLTVAESQVMARDQFQKLNTFCAIHISG